MDPSTNIRGKKLDFPAIPVTLAHFIQHFQEQCNNGIPVEVTVHPYLLYEKKAREIFVQQCEEPRQPVLNCFPIFVHSNRPIITSARRLDQESSLHQQKFLFPLDESCRRVDGSPAMVQSLPEFYRNWDIFTERCLEGLNWENIVAAGSSVVVPLLPVPGEHAVSTAAQR